jgi:hypothetical protein
VTDYSVGKVLTEVVYADDLLPDPGQALTVSVNGVMGPLTGPIWIGMYQHNAADRDWLNEKWAVLNQQGLASAAFVAPFELGVYNFRAFAPDAQGRAGPQTRRLAVSQDVQVVATAASHSGGLSIIGGNRSLDGLTADAYILYDWWYNGATVGGNRVALYVRGAADASPVTNESVEVGMTVVGQQGSGAALEIPVGIAANIYELRLFEGVVNKNTRLATSEPIGIGLNVPDARVRRVWDRILNSNSSEQWVYYEISHPTRESYVGLFAEGGTVPLKYERLHPSLTEGVSKFLIDAATFPAGYYEARYVSEYLAAPVAFTPRFRVLASW